jgi:putative transposase
MANTPGRGHGALRIGRWSDGGANYFLTSCIDERRSGLHAPAVTTAILDLACRMSIGRVWSLRTCVIMPDHVHLLVTLGLDEDLSGALRLFKGRSAPLLRAVGLRWQKGFFDRRMRDSEDLLSVFLYIYLNPNRAGLLKREETWPGYFCSENDWTWFGQLSGVDGPLPEWLL